MNINTLASIKVVDFRILSVLVNLLRNAASGANAHYSFMLLSWRPKARAAEQLHRSGAESGVAAAVAGCFTMAASISPVFDVLTFGNPNSARFDIPLLSYIALKLRSLYSASKLLKV